MRYQGQASKLNRRIQSSNTVSCLKKNIPISIHIQHDPLFEVMNVIIQYPEDPSHACEERIPRPSRQTSRVRLPAD